MGYLNLATWDRLLRLVGGAMMLYLGWIALGEGVLAAALMIFGWIPLVTGAIGWCPIYAIFGLATRAKRRRS